MRILIFVISLMLIASCKKLSNTPTNTPVEPVVIILPSNDSIDINSDKVYDFVFSYQQFATSDIPSSAGSINGLISPLGQNEFLNSNLDGYLFLKLNDTIRKTPSAGLGWDKSTADLMVIKRKFQYWDNWTVLSKNNSPYYLGYKLIGNGIETIGWLNIEFNFINGKMTIIDNDYSDANELIISKKI